MEKGLLLKPGSGLHAAVGVIMIYRLHIVVDISSLRVILLIAQTVTTALLLWDQIYRRNSSLQAVCDTPIARVAGCVSSLHGYRSAPPLGTSLWQGQQGDVSRSVHGNYKKKTVLRGEKSDGCGMHQFIVYTV